MKTISISDLAKRTSLDENFLLDSVALFTNNYWLEDHFIEVLTDFELTYLVDIGLAPWLVWESLERNQKPNKVHKDSMFSKDLAYCLGCGHDVILA